MSNKLSKKVDKRTFKWWGVAFAWCLMIAMATRMPIFTGASTEAMLQNPFFDSEFLNFIFRKAVHLMAFGLLAVFFWLALKGHRFRYMLAWLLASVYGGVDEWHQTFVPERDGVITDVIINSVGAMFALSVVFVFIRKKDTRDDNDN